MNKLSLIVVMSALLLCAGRPAQAETLEFAPKHYVQVGVGDPILSSIMANLYLVGNYGLLSSDLEYTRQSNLPTFSASYHYAFDFGLQVGGEIFYTGIFRNAINTESGKEHSYAGHVLCVQPEVRYAYINNKNFGMYSGIGVGIYLYADKGKHFRNPDAAATSNTRILPAFQLTAAGFRFGNRVYGFAELGIGSKGFVTAGIGGRF